MQIELPADARSILLIGANRLGDAVLTTGVLAWLVERYPQARFTLACGPVAADLFRAVPRLDRLIVLRKQPHHRHWFDLWRQCVGTSWDLIVDMRNSLASRLLRARCRAYPPAHSSGRHKVVDNAAALRLDPPPGPFLWIDPESQRKAEALLPQAGTCLALGPCANWAAKQWPVDRFAALALALTADDGLMPGAGVLVAAAPDERDQIAALFDALPAVRVVDAIGCDLLTIAACFRRCRLFVGNDSGLMHMAAAVGVPTLGLFGPGFPQVYGPWGEGAAYIQTPEAVATLLARAKEPGVNLMATLTLASVKQAAERLLQDGYA